MFTLTAGFQEWLERWAPAAEWGVAIGTALLALATWRLARRAGEEAEAVRRESELVARQVELQAEQLSATHRPLVTPTLGPGQVMGSRSLYTTNSGSGPALNIVGSLYWNGDTPGSASIPPYALGIGESAEATRTGVITTKLDWYTLVGFLRYRDLAGREWQTHFRSQFDASGNEAIEVRAVGSTDEFGEPAYNATGWVNKPADVRLWSSKGN